MERRWRAERTAREARSPERRVPALARRQAVRIAPNRFRVPHDRCQRQQRVRVQVRGASIRWDRYIFDIRLATSGLASLLYIAYIAIPLYAPVISCT